MLRTSIVVMKTLFLSISEILGALNVEQSVRMRMVEYMKVGFSLPCYFVNSGNGEKVPWRLPKPNNSV